MAVVGVISGFILSTYLISRKVNMGLALFFGALLTGLLAGLPPLVIGSEILKVTVDPVVLQLMAIVALISGLGYVLKDTGDLDHMINALVEIFKDGRLLSMALPALIGTLSAPGGAILSAPLVEESGNKIGLDNTRKTAVNLFFRHIGYFVYPLYSSIILISELTDLDKTELIIYNVPIMIAGIISAYFIMFYGTKKREEEVTDKSFWKSILEFLLSFLPILVVLLLAIVLEFPFYLAAMVGLLIAVLKNPPQYGRKAEYKRRARGLFSKGIKYNLILVIFGIMSFKAVVEQSGAVTKIANLLMSTGIPLYILIIILGFITAYIVGAHVAATGIMLALFVPMIPEVSLAPYISLLLTSVVMGYLISPIHLCLMLTKDYYQVELFKVYKLLLVPIIVMILTALLQVLLLA